MSKVDEVPTKKLPTKIYIPLNWLENAGDDFATQTEPDQIEYVRSVSLGAGPTDGKLQVLAHEVAHYVNAVRVEGAVAILRRALNRSELANVTQVDADDKEK